MQPRDVVALLAIGFLVVVLGYVLIRWAWGERIEQPRPRDYNLTKVGQRELEWRPIEKWGKTYVTDVLNAVGEEIDAIWPS